MTITNPFLEPEQAADLAAEPEVKIDLKPDPSKPADWKVDPERSWGADQSGIYVRAIGPDGRWGSHDMVTLDRESFLGFVRSRGEVSTWAEGILLILLGHPREV